MKALAFSGHGVGRAVALAIGLGTIAVAARALVTASLVVDHAEATVDNTDGSTYDDELSLRGDPWPSMLAGVGVLGCAARRCRRYATQAPAQWGRARGLLVAWLLPFALLLPSAGHAEPLPLGYVVWDVTDPGVSGQFDIVNQTGPNASGDGTWPVDTAASFANLALMVHYNNGTSSVFGSGYFTLGGDGLSFDGTPIAIGAGVLPTDATLSGVFGTTRVSLFDGQTVTLMPSFTSTIAFDAGGLADGDFQLIEATQTIAAPVPEPETAGLMLMGLAALALARRGSMRKLAPRGAGAAAIACAIASAPAMAAVKLNAYVAPSTGVAGTTLVNITATGAPLAPSPLPLRSATVTLAESCGGPAVGTASASSSQWVVGSAYRIQFALPASLLARTYAASVTGTTSGGSAFVSSNCSLVNVTAPRDGWKTLIGRSWTMPSHTEAFRCTLLAVTSDAYISAFRPVSPQADYEKLLSVTDGLPSGRTTGDFNCNGFEGRTGKGMFASGAGTGDFMLPTGTTVHVRPGQYLLLNVHVFNGSDDPVTATSGIQVQTVDAAQSVAEAEMFYVELTSISIPSDNQPHALRGICLRTFTQGDYVVFAAQPRMHGLGTHDNLTLLHSRTNDQTVFDADYSATSQPIYPITPPVAFGVIPVIGQGLWAATCTYQNNTGSTVHYSESPTDEICRFALYRTPLEVVDGTGLGTVARCTPP